MAVYLNANSRVIVQGITGSMGAKHTELMLAAGTQVVGGVNARKAGSSVTHRGADGHELTLPVFATVAQAMEETGANVSVIFVPPAFAKEAAIEAVDAGMPLIVVITEGIPVHDSVQVVARIREANAARAQLNTHLPPIRMIGPNCPGIISPLSAGAVAAAEAGAGAATTSVVAGITPADITGRGPIGLVSKSGTLTYQLMHELRDIGFSTAIGIGGDPIVGTTHIDALQAFEDDPDTEIIVMIGEIGGDAEERAAAYIGQHISKPVVGYVAGFSAPEGKTMGHAGAIVTGSLGTAAAKKQALEAVGVAVGKTPSHTADLVRAALQA